MFKLCLILKNISSYCVLYLFILKVANKNKYKLYGKGSYFHFILMHKRLDIPGQAVFIFIVFVIPRKLSTTY